MNCVQEPLTEEVIKQFHFILKSNTSDSRKDWFRVGDYKQRPNIVGDTPATSPGKVAKEIQQLLSEYLAREAVDFNDIVEFHYCFECIHPFQDGNTRTTVVFMELCLNNIGFDVNNMFKECSQYYRNALVCLNYADYAKGIDADFSFLERFY